MASKLCKKCKLQKECKDLPGFCLLLPFAAVISIVILLIYSFINSHLR